MLDAILLLAAARVHLRTTRSRPATHEGKVFRLDTRASPTHSDICVCTRQDSELSTDAEVILTPLLLSQARLHVRHHSDRRSESINWRILSLAGKRSIYASSDNRRPREEVCPLGMRPNGRSSVERLDIASFSHDPVVGPSGTAHCPFSAPNLRHRYRCLLSPLPRPPSNYVCAVLCRLPLSAIPCIPNGRR